MKHDFKTLLQCRKYDPAAQPEPDQVVLRIEGRNIGSIGNFITISGLPKRGKGKFIAAMTAAAISRAPVWGMSLKTPDGRGRIGFFDTDQSRYDFYQNIELINQLAGLNQISPFLDAYNVRQDDPAAICNMIDLYLKENPDCSLLVIDNIGDLVMNFNDEGQSKKLINYFKRITEEKKILIITALHLGKGNNSTIGHLGAMNDRYAQTTLVCEKIQSVYQLSIKDSRTAADINPIAIHFNTWAQTWEETISQAAAENAEKIRPLKPRPADLDIEDVRRKFTQIFADQSVIQYEPLIDMTKEFFAAGRNWAVDCIKHAREQGIIFRIPEGYTRNNQKKLYAER